MLLSEAALDDVAHSCSEFEVELQLLESSSSSTLRRGFQATVYVSSIMQNAVIDNIHDRVSTTSTTACIYYLGVYVNSSCIECVELKFIFAVYLFVLNCVLLQESLSQGEKGSVRCRFLHHPEFLRVGDRLVLREGPTKATGEVSKLLPLSQTTPTAAHKHSR